MKSRHQFTIARDGTALAYRVHGEGDQVIVFTNGYATSDFYWEHQVDFFSSTHKVVTWDLKGHGRSGPAHDLEACTIADCADDLRRVLDAAGVEKASFAGFSLGCQIILEAWRTLSDRITHLIPIFGTYGSPFDSLLHPAVGKRAFGFFRRVAPAFASEAMLGMHHAMSTPMAHISNKLFGMVGRDVDRHTMQPLYDHFLEIDGDTWAAMGIAAQEHTARDVLQTIGCPTLIIAGGRDLLTPPHLSLDMRERIPTAELLMLPDATHSGLFEYPEEITRAIQDFIAP